MTVAPGVGWHSEFGIEAIHSSAFFGSKGDLTSKGSPILHAHTIRRAFDLLGLDGVLCDQSAPLVYFKLVSRIRRAEVTELHRRFWNHGGAPILAIIAPDEVQIYSALLRPVSGSNIESQQPTLVVALERASRALREFLPSVKSGEFFRKHSRSFKPAERVDKALLDNLHATRERLSTIETKRSSADVLDAFLCRLVFTCYLFDRKVIGEAYLNRLGLTGISHLRDILGIRPRSGAKIALYRLFRKLAEDFNGDLFSDDLDAELNLISVAHVEEVDEFFQGTDIETRQKSLWPYDFEAIPIETISAIYERFLKSADKESGSFYTPRFLAELVLDIALSGHSSLLGLRFLDPACGSGIFLVGLFNRIAEEWKRTNPTARNDRKARELMELLRTSLFGIDSNPTACRISAFSLYLAYLDQLSPRDIQELQAKGRALPKLVKHSQQIGDVTSTGGIWCGDFFDEGRDYPSTVDVVAGNPPWGSTAGPSTLAATWLTRKALEVPDAQIAAAFMLKAATHASQQGNVCLILPHGILFNHSRAALSFQKAFVQKYALNRVVNLTDYQAFLFSEARHPALILSYCNVEPSKGHTVKYWVPKTDWKVLKAELIEISEQDRTNLPLRSILRDLEQEDAPQIWKRMSWATARDRKLLDRLADLPRLRDQVRQVRDKVSGKPWLVAEGFQPLGENDSRDDAAIIELPTDLFIEASSPHLALLLLEEDCSKRRSRRVQVRSRSNKTTAIFNSPHVLVAKGFGSIAFADFPVSFRHALRGITGPAEDRHKLMFLAAYLRSSLAKYYQFHTSSNWGVSRQEVHVSELLRLPFPLPASLDNPDRGNAIVEEAARLMRKAIRDASGPLVDRTHLVAEVQRELEPLIYEYFDVTESEQILINDTVNIATESFRPSSKRRHIPAIEQSTSEIRARYADRLCKTLNSWARGKTKVVGSTIASTTTGLGLVTLERSALNSDVKVFDEADLLAALTRIREVTSVEANTFELARSIKLFEGPRLHMIKRLDRRYWSETAALNDADEIAGAILMQSVEMSA